jgi:hypothetical protein
MPVTLAAPASSPRVIFACCWLLSAAMFPAARPTQAQNLRATGAAIDRLCAIIPNASDSWIQSTDSNDRGEWVCTKMYGRSRDDQDGHATIQITAKPSEARELLGEPREGREGTSRYGDAGFINHTDGSRRIYGIIFAYGCYYVAIHTDFEDRAEPFRQRADEIDRTLKAMPRCPDGAPGSRRWPIFAVLAVLGVIILARRGKSGGPKPQTAAPVGQPGSATTGRSSEDTPARWQSASTSTVSPRAPRELPDLPRSRPETREPVRDSDPLGPPETLPEPVDPSEVEDPIARAKRLGKRAIDAAKKEVKGKPAAKAKGKPAAKGDNQNKIGEIDSPELTNLKRDLAEWEARNSSQGPKADDKSKKELTELDKLKAAQKRAEEEADKKFLDDLEREEREEEEQEKKDNAWAENQVKERHARELARQQAEKERQEKEAEERRKEAERAAAEEAELKLRREERERARREEAAREEAEEEAEAEAARKAAAADAAAKDAARSRETESERAEREIDDWYREEAFEKAKEADARERKRLRDLGFDDYDIAKYRRDLGMMEAGTYERSANRMWRAEFLSDWVSYGVDRALDLTSLIAGPVGSTVKNTYTATKYYSGSAFGDVLPGGEGVTPQRRKTGARDAVIELGVGIAQDLLLDRLSKSYSIFKGSRVAENTDLSGAASIFLKGTGAVVEAANKARATAYVEALMGTVGRGTFWNFVGDRYKNLLKGNRMKASTNAYESYVLKLPPE